MPDSVINKRQASPCRVETAAKAVSRRIAWHPFEGGTTSPCDKTHRPRQDQPRNGGAVRDEPETAQRPSLSTGSRTLRVGRAAHQIQDCVSMCPLMQVAGCLRMAHSCLDIPPARLLKLLGRYAGNALNLREHLLPCLHPPSIEYRHPAPGARSPGTCRVSAERGTCQRACCTECTVSSWGALPNICSSNLAGIVEIWSWELSGRNVAATVAEIFSASARQEIGRLFTKIVNSAGHHQNHAHCQDMRPGQTLHNGKSRHFDVQGCRQLSGKKLGEQSGTEYMTWC